MFEDIKAEEYCIWVYKGETINTDILNQYENAELLYYGRRSIILEWDYCNEYYYSLCDFCSDLIHFNLMYLLLLGNNNLFRKYKHKWKNTIISIVNDLINIEVEPHIDKVWGINVNTINRIYTTKLKYDNLDIISDALSCLNVETQYQKDLIKQLISNAEYYMNLNNIVAYNIFNAILESVKTSNINILKQAINRL